MVGLVRGIERGEKLLDEIAGEMGWNRRATEVEPAVLDYARLRATISERERAQSRMSRLARRRACSDALAELRRGDIINVTGRRGGLAVVLEPANASEDPRPLVLTENRWAGRISSADYSGATTPMGSMNLPKRVEHRQPKVRRDLASALRSAADGLVITADRNRRGGAAEPADTDPELVALRESMRRHPGHRMADREAVARIGERYLRVERDNDQIRVKVSAATNSLSRTFDRIVGLLT